MLKQILIAFLLMFSPGVFAQSGLLSIQIWAIQYAEQAGKADNLSKTEAAIIAQESSLCTDLENPEDPSYGCGGVTLEAASAVGVDATPTRLKTDHKLNIQISEHYLALCIKKMGSWERGVVCYNKGPEAAKRLSEVEVQNDPYLAAIRMRMREQS